MGDQIASAAPRAAHAHGACVPATLLALHLAVELVDDALHFLFPFVTAGEILLPAAGKQGTQGKVVSADCGITQYWLIRRMQGSRQGAQPQKCRECSGAHRHGSENEEGLSHEVP